MESDEIGSFETKLNSHMGQRNFLEAEIIVFNKINKFAPNFHRHMLAGKIAGRILSVGDRIMIYRVAETYPSGSVIVTDRTRVEVR